MPSDHLLRFGRYRLHPTQGLTCGREEVRVTPKSLAVLCALVERSGEVVTKDELFRTVWPDATVSDAALTSCIVELRRALGDDARQPRYIETLHRRGFRFIARDAHAPSAHETHGPITTPSAPRADIVGREHPIGEMSRALERAAGGRRHVVVVTGQAGIGKTAVVGEFVARVLSDETWRIARGDCVERYGAGEAYQPLLEALTRLCLQRDGEHVVAVLRACAPTWLAQLPAVQTPAELADLRRRSAGVTSERMLRELTDALEAMTARSPIVLCLEDLHWSDSSTLDWIASFARRPEPARVLLICTYRPGEAARAAASPEAMAHSLSVKGLCTEIALGGLGEQDVTDYVLARFPPAPAADSQLVRLGQLAFRHTEGNPLFLVNVLADLMARGVLVSGDDRWTVYGDVEPSSLRIPPDVHRTIERQIDRLGVTERRLLEVAALLGSQCCAAAVAAGAGCSVGEAEDTLGALARRGTLVRAGAALEWPDGTLSARFEFLHALYAEVLAGRLSPGRSAELHRQIGVRLEAAYGERAAEIAAELAVHFDRGRDLPRAIQYLHHAAELDRRRSALDGAEQHFHRALELIQKLPVSAERDEREAALQIGLGSVLMQLRGWGAREVEEAYGRARALCTERPASPQLFPSLFNLWIFYIARGRLDAAQELVGRLFELARASSDGAMLLQAHHAQWSTLFTLGDLRGAEAHAREGIRLSESTPTGRAIDYGSHDAGICARAFCARALALLGSTDAAARMGDQAVTLARALDHPFTLAFTLVHAAAVHQARRDAVASRACASEAHDIASDQSFGLMLAWADGFLGWARTALGESRDGLTMLEDGVARARATGSAVFLTHMLGLLADAQHRLGLVDESWLSVHDAMMVAARTAESFHLPELHRLRGELRLAAADGEETRRLAEEDFRTALATADGRHAWQLSLRAAVSLARLWSRAGLSADAAALLVLARDRVVEGLDLPDVAEATALLSQVERRPSRSA